jgi:tol-pal system protein YbgF
VRVSFKTFIICGLACCAGPFAVASLQAQDYIDLEEEREAAREAADNAAPGTSPATTYPATSYGLGTVPPGAALPAAETATGTSPYGAGSQVLNPAQGGQNVGALLYQMQQLQQEVMMLNGKVEELSHELRRLKEQSLERYVDLDRRLGSAAGGSAAAAATSIGATPARGSASTAAVGGSRGVEQPGEGDAYRAAYGLVRNQRFGDAAGAFRQFLLDYPAGRYAPNAHYWLGELYLVIDPPDLEASRQAFTLLLDQYPDNPKTPDALYKLGKVHYLKGNRERAREFLDRLIRDYGSSNSSAVQLAREFINENY